MRPEGLSQLKILVTPSEIEPTAFRLLAQCLNQLSHSVHSTQRSIHSLENSQIRLKFSYNYNLYFNYIILIINIIRNNVLHTALYAMTYGRPSIMQII
jgi:hypothetical protein